MKKTEIKLSAGMSRREFLTRCTAAAGALAIPSIIPASALGRDGAVAPSERIILGGIGIGSRGGGDLSMFLGLPQVQFVAVCDVQKKAREATVKMVQSKYGKNAACATYSDIRQFLAERTDLEAVLIATGNRWHAPASIMAMRAGLDVYCEKPGCLTMAEGRLVVETARQFGRVFTTGAQRLSEPVHIFGREMARTGRLGQIHTVYADARAGARLRFDQLPAEPAPPREEIDWDAWVGPTPWRPYNKAYLNHYAKDGWGNFYDMSHDIAEWGAHTIIQALPGLDTSKISPIELEYAPNRKDMTLHLASGVKIVLCREEVIWVPVGKYFSGSCGNRFAGSEGWVSAGDGALRPEVSSPSLMGEYKKVLSEYTAQTQRTLNHWQDFIDCVRSRRDPAANAQLMFDSMALNLAADICCQLQRNLKFDLKKTEFLGDDEANRLRSRGLREPWCV